MEVNTNSNYLPSNVWRDKFEVAYCGNKRLVNARNLYATEYHVRPGTEVICDSAFINSSVERIVLPDSLLAIGETAFANCKNLSTITLPDNILQIGKNAFQCTKLKEIIFPRELCKLGSLGWGLERLRNLDFSKVTKLKVIPDDFIGDEASQLKQLVIPIGVTKIEENLGGEKLGKLFLPPSIEEVEYLYNWDIDIYCFSPAIKELEPIVGLIYDNCDEDEYEEYAIHLYVLPEFLESYKTQRDAEEISEKALVIDVMPEEFRYYYDK